MLVLLLVLIIVALLVFIQPTLRRKSAAVLDQPVGRVRFRLGLQSPRATVRAVLRQVKAEARVMLSNVWLPNHVVVYMNPHELDRLGGARRQLADDIRSVIERQALPNEKTRTPSHYFVPNRVTVRMVPDDDVKPGTYRIEAWIEEATVLNAVDKTEPTRAPTPGGTLALLLHVRLDQDRRAYPLPLGRVVIGRSAVANVRIPDKQISREHAELVIRGPSHITLADLDSANGTYLNGQPIRGAVQLGAGERFRLGTAAEAYVVSRPHDARSEYRA